MTEGLKEEKIREIIKAIQEGKFAVTPEMLGLKKKNFLKRFIDSRRNKHILDCPKKDPIAGIVLKGTKPTDDGNFIPRVKTSTQPWIPAISEDTIANDEKEITE